VWGSDAIDLLHFVDVLAAEGTLYELFAAFEAGAHVAALQEDAVAREVETDLTHIVILPLLVLSTLSGDLREELPLGRHLRLPLLLPGVVARVDDGEGGRFIVARSCGGLGVGGPRQEAGEEAADVAREPQHQNAAAADEHERHRHEQEPRGVREEVDFDAVRGPETVEAVLTLVAREVAAPVVIVTQADLILLLTQASPVVGAVASGAFDPERGGREEEEEEGGQEDQRRAPEGAMGEHRKKIAGVQCSAEADR